MYKLLTTLMLLSALHQLGISIARFASCRSRACIQQIEKASCDVLRVDWQPISVFVRPDKGVFYRPHKDGLGPETAGSERGLRSSR